jgi:hypothetical protein
MEIINLTHNPSYSEPLVLGGKGSAAELLISLEADGRATIQAHQERDCARKPSDGWVGDCWEWRARCGIGESYIIDETEIETSIPNLERLLNIIHQGTEYGNPYNPKISQLSQDAIKAAAEITEELRYIYWTKKQVQLVDPADWLSARGVNSAARILGDIEDRRILNPVLETYILQELAEKFHHEAKRARVVFEGSMEDALRDVIRSRQEQLRLAPKTAPLKRDSQQVLPSS